eukprot:jgi/Astpho2/479/fgenesh1_pg.00011_%23_59_t
MLPAAHSPLQLSANWHVLPSGGLQLSVGTAAGAAGGSPLKVLAGPAGEQGSGQACCTSSSMMHSMDGLAGATQQAWQTRGPVALAQVCQVSCHSQQDELHCLIVLPGCSATLRPIYSKRVCNLPLAQTLAEDLRQRHQHPQVVSAQSGLLSMDQARSLLPLLADDPTAYTVPVVGVWVSGVASASHPLVWAACLKFLASGQLQDKALMADGAFLLLLYQTGTAQPACFEVHVTGHEGSIPVTMWRGNISLRSGSRVVGDHLKCPLVQLRHITAALPISPGHKQGDLPGVKLLPSHGSPGTGSAVRQSSPGVSSEEPAPRQGTLPRPHTPPSSSFAQLQGSRPLAVRSRMGSATPSGPAVCTHPPSGVRGAPWSYAESGGMEYAQMWTPPQEHGGDVTASWQAPGPGMQQWRPPGLAQPDAVALQQEVADLRQQVLQMQLASVHAEQAAPAAPLPAPTSSCGVNTTFVWRPEAGSSRRGSPACSPQQASSSAALQSIAAAGSALDVVTQEEDKSLHQPPPAAATLKDEGHASEQSFASSTARSSVASRRPEGGAAAHARLLHLQQLEPGTPPASGGRDSDQSLGLARPDSPGTQSPAGTAEQSWLPEGGPASLPDEQAAQQQPGPAQHGTPAAGAGVEHRALASHAAAEAGQGSGQQPAGSVLPTALWQKQSVLAGRLHSQGRPSALLHHSSSSNDLAPSLSSDGEDPGPMAGAEQSLPSNLDSAWGSMDQSSAPQAASTGMLEASPQPSRPPLLDARRSTAASSLGALRSGTAPGREHVRACGAGPGLRSSSTGAPATSGCMSIVRTQFLPAPEPSESDDDEVRGGAAELAEWTGYKSLTLNAGTSNPREWLLQDARLERKYGIMRGISSDGNDDSTAVIAAGDLLFEPND